MIRKIQYIFILGFAVLAFASCGKTEEEKSSHVSQKDTQTTGVISGTSVDVYKSDTIDKKELLPVSCSKKDTTYEKILQSGKYTWDKPYVKVNPYGNSPLTAYIIFQTKESCKVQVTVKGKTEQADVTGKIGSSKKHRIPVIGLYPGTTNKVTLTCLDDKGKKIRSQVMKIKTSALSDKLKDSIKVEKHTKTSAYGLTIISGQSTVYPFAYDENGDIRWYITMTTGSYGVFPLANKRLIYQTDEALTPTEEKPHTTQMYEMDYLGRAYQIYYVKNGIHHEVIEKQAGGNLFVLTSSIDGHTEDVVEEIDRKTGSIVKSLDMRKIFDDTYCDKVDWAHLNTVSYRKTDNTVLLSPRNLHAAVRVDWKTNKIKWILANPEMFEGTEQEDKVLKPEGDVKWHFQQHSVYEIPYDLDGDPDTIHIMMFDNHWQTKRKVDFFDNDESSYVSVYTVNEKKMTVRQEKCFPGVRSIITSNCAYNQSTNRMFSFGGYLYPLVKGQKGMIYEFDYKSRNVINQYSTKKYFYRGYKMTVDYDDLAKPLDIGSDYVKGTLQAPIKLKSAEIPSEKAKASYAQFTLKESVLYMNTSDHAITKIRFIGKNNCYQMDYSSAGKGMKEKKNQKYAIAIPLSGMKKDKYEVVINYEGKWYDTGKNITKSPQKK